VGEITDICILSLLKGSGVWVLISPASYLAPLLLYLKLFLFPSLSVLTDYYYLGSLLLGFCSDGMPVQGNAKLRRQLPTRMYSATLSQIGLWLAAVPHRSKCSMFLSCGYCSVGCCFLLVSLPLCYPCTHAPCVRCYMGTFETPVESQCRVHSVKVFEYRGGCAWYSGSQWKHGLIKYRVVLCVCELLGIPGISGTTERTFQTWVFLSWVRRSGNSKRSLPGAPRPLQDPKQNIPGIGLSAQGRNSSCIGDVRPECQASLELYG
jgi:hypothetical protein